MTLETVQADIALDPMAGTGRIVYSPDYEREPAPLRGCFCVGPQPGEMECPCQLRSKMQVIAPALPTPTRAEPSSEPEKINIGVLALDLGHRTGWAIRNRDGRLQYGTHDFRPKASWSPGQKWSRFRSWLSQAVTQRGITHIAYEDVRRHLGTDAAHAYGGFLAMLEMVADQHNVTLAPVAVGTIKKHWTGSGNAKKDAMIAEAKRRGFHPDTDNAADALAILSWAVAQEAK